MTQLRVAVVFEIPTPYRQPVFERLARDENGTYRFFFLARTQEDRLWKMESTSGLPATYLPGRQICLKGHHTIHLNWGLKGLLLNPPFDVYVLGGYAQPAIWKLLRWCWKSGTPYVMCSESHLRKKRPLWLRGIKGPWVRKVYARSSANLVTGSEAQAYAEHYGARRESIFRFPNSIDGPEYAARVDQERVHQQAHRKTLRLSQGPITLFVGALNYRKGVDLLIAAFREVASRISNSSLVLVGNGSWESALRTQVEQSGLSKQVTFLGFVQPSDLPKIYACSDLMVLPSREETFGAVICEALAARLPVITTDAVGAARDFVISEKTGLVVPSDDAPSLATAMLRLLSDKNLRSNMSAAAHAHMQPWTHDRMAAELRNSVRAALA
ncbi:MAG TPA: glycosyltransferase family 4 protein [Bdellovibrionota bacterium]|nr:glycosyltransferase family 4 protein [Bdellovibrionota bacterium]